MNNSITTIVILILFFSVFSCSKDSVFEPGVFDGPEKTLIETNVICARFQENQEQVKLIVEDLLNTSDDREAEFPIVDFLSLSVDINNNNLIDTDIDKRYSITSIGSNCMQFILTQTSSTTCIEEEGYTYNASYKSSTKSSDEHIIYELILNKENIFFDSQMVGLIFNLRGEDSGGAIPSITSPLFIETINFSL